MELLLLESFNYTFEELSDFIVAHLLFVTALNHFITVQKNVCCKTSASTLLC